MKTKTRSVNANTLKAIGACVMSAVMATSMFAGPVYAESSSSQDYSDVEKTETVYATLNNDGSLSSTIVSSWMHDDNGINNIKEDLDLKNVENIKTDEEPTKNGKTYTWNVKGNDVYYQGDSTKQLPVNVSIKYELDGQPISAKNIQGKSGHVKIQIHYKNNQSEIINSGGKNIIVHPGFLAGGVLRLDTGDYTNVTCDEGKVISDGTNEILAFASVPGLEETLDSAGLERLSDKLQAHDTCTIEADAKNFDIGNLFIGMSSDFDLEDLTEINQIPDLAGSVNQMVSASEQLQSGAEQLASGTATLKTSAAPLTSAGPQITQLGNAFITLNNGAQQLHAGINQYTNGVDLLAAGTQQLYGITDGIGQVQTAVGSSATQPGTLYNGAYQLNKGLEQLDASVSNIDENQLNQLNDQLTTSKKQLQSMSTMIDKDQQTLTKLQSGLNTTQQTLTQLGNEEKQLDALATDLLTQIGTAQKKIDADNTQINGEVDKINAEIDAANKQIDTINQTIDTINSTIDSDNDAIAQAENSANSSLNSQWASAQSSLNSAVNTAKSSGSDEQKEAMSGVSAPSLGSAPIVKLNRIDAQKVSKVESIKHISADDLKLSKVDDESKAIQTDFSTLSKSLSSLNNVIGGMNDTISTSQKALASLDSDIDTSIQGVDSMQQMIYKANTQLSGTDYVTLIKQLKAASAQLNAGSSQLVDGVEQLNSGLNTLQKQSKSGIDTANAGAKQLSSNSASLRSGSSQLASGTSVLASEKGQMDSMASGLSQLGSAFDQLNSGANELASGEAQFNAEAMAPLKKMADLTEGEVGVLTDCMNAIKDMTKENSNFAGAPKGAKTKVSYVLRTGE